MSIIRKITIHNFKSINHLELYLQPINFIVGLNGCGKSTILHALMLASKVVSGDVEEWLRGMDWFGSDFLNKAVKNESYPHISIEAEFGAKDLIHWGFDFDFVAMNPVNEFITINGENIPLKMGIGAFSHDKGSVLNHLELDNSEYALSLNKLLQLINGLYCIDPNIKLITNTIMQLDGPNKDSLLSQLRKFHPNILNFFVNVNDSGMPRLVFSLNTPFQNIEVNADHIGQGVLHILAILVQLGLKHPVLLFESIDESIGQESIQHLADLLLQAKNNSQIIITTHRHQLLNHIPNEVAKSGLKYIFKTLNGETKNINFFELPYILDKLHTMGVGDALLNTDLSDLSNYY